MKRNSIFLLTALLIFSLLLSYCKNQPVTSIESFDGVKVSFDNKGEGETAVILIHGWANTRAIWQKQTAHFSEKYQVIAVDLPGFGESGEKRTNWSMENFGKDISCIIEQLALKQVVIVGFSMGGPVAIEAALQSKEQVEGVVIVDQMQELEMKFPPQVIEQFDSVMMDLVNNLTKEKLLAGGFFKKNIDTGYELAKSFMKDSTKTGWRESFLASINWQNERATESVKALKVPIMAINSDLHPTNVESFRKYAPSFKVKIMKGVGHGVMWDDPDMFNQLLEESIQSFINK